MKKIITLPILILSLNCFSQLDSSRFKISITIGARDCEYVSLLIEKTNKFEGLDSTLKSKFRIASPPSNATNVVVDSIEGRVWLDINRSLSMDITALHANCFKRVDDAIRLTNSTWIVNKLNRDATSRDGDYDSRRSIGRLYLRKLQEN